MSTTCCIIRLCWGRASRAVTLAELATPPSAADPGPQLATGALAAASAEDDVPAGPTVGELAAGEIPVTEPDEPALIPRSARRMSRN